MNQAPDMANTSPQFDYLKLESALKKAKGHKPLLLQIVNAPFDIDKVNTALIFLGIIVLLIVDKKTKNIYRVALTSNDFAEATLAVSAKKFEDIKIPLGDSQNIIAQAIKKQLPTKTTDWRLLFTPDLTAEQARINQASAGIAVSYVYPLIGVGEGAAMIFSYYQYPENIGKDQTDFMENYSALVARALRS